MEKPGIINSTFSFLSATRYHVNGGIILIISAIVALIIANSPWSAQYFALWQHEIRLQIGGFNLFNHHGEALTVIGFINDALMSVFFFTVGLEIKREILVGELSSVRQALLPIVAAVGGVLLPVILMWVVASGTEAMQGLAIPMATDIAFSLGVLSLLGKRVPVSLKVFLTAFAVVDDILGILVIAIFYSGQIYWGELLLALALVALLIGANLCQVRRRWFYIGVGIAIWYLFMQSGVHATIAGVVVAFTIPATPSYKIRKYVKRIKEATDDLGDVHKFDGRIMGKQQINALKKIESASDRVISPLQSLEDDLHAVVNYAIMPLFAFANAGVAVFLPGHHLTFGTTAIGILTGLLVGKFVGIFFVTWCMVRLKISELPSGMTMQQLAGVSMLGGVGFTVSLFIANLSFSGQAELLSQAKLGVLTGTFVAGVLAFAMLKWSTRPPAMKDKA